MSDDWAERVRRYRELLARIKRDHPELTEEQLKKIEINLLQKFRL